MTGTMKRQGYVKRYLKYHLREKGAAVILGALFLAGLAAGCACARLLSQETWEILSAVCAPPGRDRSFLLLLGDYFFSMTGFLVFWLLCGFSAVGPLFSAGAVFLRGGGYGLAAICLYSVGIGAVPWYYLLVVVPQMVFWLLVAVPAAQKSIALSASLLASLLYGAKPENAPTAGQYLMNYLLLWGGAAAYALPCALLELLYRKIA